MTAGAGALLLLGVSLLGGGLLVTLGCLWGDLEREVRVRVEENEHRGVKRSIGQDLHARLR